MREGLRRGWAKCDRSSKKNGSKWGAFIGKILSTTLEGREAQTLAGGALFDLEQLAEAQSILVPSESLLVQLELS